MARINAFVAGGIVFAFIVWVASQTVLPKSPSSEPQVCDATQECKVSVSTSWVAWSAVDHDTTVLGSGVTQVVFQATTNNNFIRDSGIVFKEPGFTCTPDNASNPTKITCTVPTDPSKRTSKHKYTVTLKGTFALDPWVVN